MPTTTSYREACVETVRLRLRGRDGFATVAELHASLPSWPRPRLLRAIFDLRTADEVTIVSHRGQPIEVRLTSSATQAVFA